MTLGEERSRANAIEQPTPMMGCENAYNRTKIIGSRNLMQRYLFLALCELEHGDGVAWRRISARTDGRTKAEVGKH